MLLFQTRGQWLATIVLAVLVAAAWTLAGLGGWPPTLLREGCGPRIRTRRLGNRLLALARLPALKD